MGKRAGLSGAVVVVRDLARSETFYRELLDLRVIASSGEAVLLEARDGDHLVLRELGKAPHVMGGIGVLFLVWSAGSLDDVERCVEVLRAHDALLTRSVEDGWAVVEGHDPDNTRVVVVFREGDDPGLVAMPPPIFSY